MKSRVVGLAELVTELDEQVAANPLPSVAAASTESGGSFVLFRAAATTFAVPVEAVATVLQAPPICRLPAAPYWLAGVFYWSGSVVPLLAGATIPSLLDAGEVGAGPGLETPDQQGARRCLILSSAEIKIGLQVDEVFGVHRLELESGRGRILQEAEPRRNRVLGAGPVSKLSDTLQWRVATAPGEQTSGAESQPGVDLEATVPVLSVVGLLASEEVTRFASRSALERGVLEPHGGQSWESAYGSEKAPRE